MIHHDTPIKNESYDNLYGILSNSIDESDYLGDVYALESAENVVAKRFSWESTSVICNTINTLLGVSLFATPWGYEESGLAGGSLILIVVAFLSYETARILLLVQKLYYQRSGEVKGYPEIAEAALGLAWSNVVKIATIVSYLPNLEMKVTVNGQYITEKAQFMTQQGADHIGKFTIMM